MGWYYTKVVRMQNAADAAVIKGVYALIGDESSLSDYTTVSDALIPVPDYLVRNEVKSERDRTQGDRAAKDSITSNIGTKWSGNVITDAWQGDDLKLSSILWDSDKEEFRTLYYEVILEENVKLFSE